MRFAVLGDLHYSEYREPLHAAARDNFFTAFFGQVAALEADLVFAIGDTTQRGLMSELEGEEAIAAEVGLKIIRTTGNHDTDSIDKPEIARFFLGQRPTASPSNTELYTSLDSGPVRFILLDTARPRVSSIDWSGFVSDEQLSWLNAQIDDFNSRPNLRQLFVMGHHPIYNTTAISTRDMLYITNSDEVKQAFAKLKKCPGFYICGHNHINSLFGPDENNWYYVQAGAPLDCEGFRLFTASESGVKIQTLDIDFSNAAVRAAFDLARTSVESGFEIHPLDWMYGKPSDRELSLTF